MSETTGFEAFTLYSAIHLHFTSSYNYFQYNGKLKRTQDQFMRHKNKYFFYKLSRKYNIDDLRDLFVANYIDGNPKWVGDITSEDGEKVYAGWKKRIESLTYIFTNDIIFLLENHKAEDLLKVPESGWPLLLQYLMNNKVCIETVLIMNDILGFLPMWVKKIDDDLIWPQYETKLKKYSGFLVYDKDRFKKILKDKVKEYAN